MIALPYSIRRATEADLSEIHRVFRESIAAVPTNHYTNEQKRVWAKSTEDKARWLGKIRSQYFIVAEQGSHLIGFASLEVNYVDFMYVHPIAQRHGVEQNLLQHIEEIARSNGIIGLESDVSKAARLFFEKNGFVVQHENQFDRFGVNMSNFSMKKG